MIAVDHWLPATSDPPRSWNQTAPRSASGRHRAPSIPDLIIAATAELAGLTVLHLDKNFDVIAELTGQPVERLNMA